MEATRLHGYSSRMWDIHFIQDSSNLARHTPDQYAFAGAQLRKKKKTSTKWKRIQWFHFSHFFQEIHLSIFRPLNQINTEQWEIFPDSHCQALHNPKLYPLRTMTSSNSKTGTRSHGLHGYTVDTLLLSCSTIKGTKRMKEDSSKLQKMIYWQVLWISLIVRMKDGQWAAWLCHGLSRQQNLMVPEFHWDLTCKHSDFTKGRNWGHVSIICLLTRANEEP